MEHQLRRGIHRPNAQCLSISLAPLVAQRSLMFRVKTDLAMKPSYAELTPTEESPALYTLSDRPQTVSAVFTADMTVISTAMSSASMYSQDSWKTASPFFPAVEIDPRQMTISHSPSEEWPDITERDDNKELTPKSSSVFSISPAPDISFSKVNEINDTESHSQPDDMSSLASNAVRRSIRSLFDVGSFGKRLTNIKLKSKKVDQPRPKESKSSKSFRKVMARLSLQLPKQELAHRQRASSIFISDNRRSLDLSKLSEFRASAIRHSFIA